MSPADELVLKLAITLRKNDRARMGLLSPAYGDGVLAKHHTRGNLAIYDVNVDPVWASNTWGQ